MYQLTIAKTGEVLHTQERPFSENILKEYVRNTGETLKIDKVSNSIEVAAKSEIATRQRQQLVSEGQ